MSRGTPSRLERAGGHRQALLGGGGVGRGGSAGGFFLRARGARRLAHAGKVPRARGCVARAGPEGVDYFFFSDSTYFTSAQRSASGITLPQGAISGEPPFEAAPLVMTSK